jgi:hypothetical protein
MRAGGRVHAISRGAGREPPRSVYEPAANPWGGPGDGAARRAPTLRPVMRRWMLPSMAARCWRVIRLSSQSPVALRGRGAWNNRRTDQVR